MAVYESIMRLEKERTHKVKNCHVLTIPLEDGVDGVVHLLDFYFMFVFWECIRFE